MKYIASMRFVIDILSLANLPNIFISDVSNSISLPLKALGLLKLSRYFRA